MELVPPPRPPTDLNGWSNLVADYLEAYGHYQGGTVADYSWPQTDEQATHGSSWGRPCCVLGASCALYYYYYNREAHFMTARLIGALRTGVGPSVGHWSDQSPTPEVIEALRGLH